MPTLQAGHSDNHLRRQRNPRLHHLHHQGKEPTIPHYEITRTTIEYTQIEAPDAYEAEEQSRSTADNEWSVDNIEYATIEVNEDGSLKLNPNGSLKYT